MDTSNDDWRARLKNSCTLATALEDAKLRDAMRRVVKRWLLSRQKHSQVTSAMSRVA